MNTNSESTVSQTPIKHDTLHSDNYGLYVFKGIENDDGEAISKNYLVKW